MAQNKVVLCVAVAAAVAALCRADMQIVKLYDAVKTSGARCLDGSPAAYYIRPATARASANKWVLFIQGGGWCYTPEQCLARTHDSTGSSDLMPSTKNLGGMLNETVLENPDFYSWNHVLFAYCDGASFTGDVAEPVLVDGTKLYFRGNRNFHAIMDDLLRNRGLRAATEVLFVGDSAGGVAAYAHADRVAELLPPTVQRYKVAPVSGVFLRHANALGEPVYEQQMQQVFAMQNSSAGVNPHCLVSKSPRYMYLCLFAEELIDHIESPVFVLNSMHDKWCARCIQAAEPVRPGAPDNGNCSAVPGWAECADREVCTEEQWRINEQWGKDFRAALGRMRALKKPGNGVFAYSCYLHDAEIFGLWKYANINGVAMREAFAKWYYSSNEPAEKHTYIDCAINGSYHCNPMCDAN